MPSLDRHKFFKKDQHRVRLSDSQHERYVIALYHLLKGESLPKEFSDHELIGGGWNGHREFHIGGDMLVIYKHYLDEDSISLIRMGTHSDLFG